jgi:myo-inositol-1(or 4)-monophosphatase
MSTALSRLSSIAGQAAALARSATPTLIDEKSVHDFVTDIDRRLQEEIFAALLQAFPGIPAFGEEGISSEQSIPDKAFLVDPLDGTGNWIVGLPFSAVSIAYLEQGVTVMAAVAGIAGAGIYSAELGRGSWNDGSRFELPRPAATLIALSTGVLDAIEVDGSYAALRRFGKLRNLGSQALQLCLVGRGSLAINASLEARLWDDAAGRLIATEAGARYCAMVPSAESARPAAYQRSLCAHPDVFDAAAKILKPVLTQQPK